MEHSIYSGIQSDCGSSFDRFEQGDMFSRRWKHIGRSRVRASKLLHIFSIIFLEFPVYPHDLSFLSPRQTSRRFVHGDSSLHDRFDTFHSSIVTSLYRASYNPWQLSYSYLFCSIHFKVNRKVVDLREGN